MRFGERVTPRSVFAVTVAQGEAAHQFVAERVVGERVLDVACGDGYGSALLAARAAEVVAVDRDPAVIRQAALRYRRPNLSFRCVSAEVLRRTFAPASFGAVCSFQFLEHVADQHWLLSVLKALVRPGGLVAVTTPNRKLFPTVNPFHAHEVDARELRALAASVFPEFDLYGVFGDAAVLRYRQSEQRVREILLRLDVFNLRRRLPLRLLRVLYGMASRSVVKPLAYRRHRSLARSVHAGHFQLRGTDLEQALDFLLLARVPDSARSVHASAPPAAAVSREPV